MATYTTTQLKTVGINPAAVSPASTPGFMVLDWIFDGSKRSTTSTDILQFYDLPAYCAVGVTAAAITVVKAATTNSNVDLRAGGSNITGLTAWDLDATAGTKLIKAATSGPLYTINTSSASALECELDTAAVGSGIFRLRMWLIVAEAPSSVA